MKALVAGWFSFEHMGATAGGLYARRALRLARQCRLLVRRSTRSSLRPGAWLRAEPEQYSHLIFVCGPFDRSWMVTQFLERLAGRHLAGVNLSMLESLETWNPYDLRSSAPRTRYVC